MKFLKNIVLSISMMGGISQAATVDITGGFGTGVDLQVSGASANYIMQIGGWDGSIFTQFGPTLSQSAGADIIGSFSAVTPTSLNSQRIYIFVGTGSDFATSIASGGYAILQSTAISPAGFFPADVSQPLGSSSAPFTSSSDFTIVASSAGTSYANSTTLNLIPIPEPSAALLGVFGGLLLLRRRRDD